MQHGVAAELLARVPVLRGIGGEFLSVIMQIGEPLRFAAHDTLAVAGMPAEAAIIILEGEVTLYTDDGREFGDPLGPGDSVNEMAMIVETQHFFSAFGANEGFALKIGNAAFGQLMGQYPWLAAHLARNIGQDLKVTAKTLHELDDMLVVSEHGLMPFVGEEGGDEAPDDAESTDRVDNVEPAIHLEPAIHAEQFDHGDQTVRANHAERPGDTDGEPFELATSLADLAVGENSALVQRLAGGHDLLADLNDAISPSDQMTPEPAHDLTASPSHALRRSL